MAVRLGAVAPSHRKRIHEILDSTAVFRPAEIAIAIELFDAAVQATPDAAGADYELLGAFAEDGAVCGYACFGPTPATDRTFDLYWLAVHAGAQGGGSGSRLLAGVEERLRARNARLLVVETSSRDDYGPTRRFYEARGFGEAARLRDFYAPADDRVIYTKRLALTPSTSRGDLDE